MNWLVTYAETGVPELALSALLQTHAKRIEVLGYVPRSWQKDANVRHFERSD